MGSVLLDRELPVTGQAVFCPWCLLVCAPLATAGPSKAWKDQGCLLGLEVGRPQVPAGASLLQLYWIQVMGAKEGVVGTASPLASGGRPLPHSPSIKGTQHPGPHLLGHSWAGAGL